jgi:predicted DsbA family dithiol-disulfide isomerase
MRHPGAADLLQQAYEQETDAEVKAHIVRVAVNLMSLNGEALLQAALHSEVEAVQHTAQQIVAERARTGVTVQFDEAAGRGSGLMKLRQPS